MKQADSIDEIFNELWTVFYENSDIRSRHGDVYYNAIDTAKRQIEDFYRNKIPEKYSKSDKLKQKYDIRDFMNGYNHAIDTITAQFNSKDNK